MHFEPLQLPWDTSGWLDDVSAWVEAQLAERTIATTGPLELIHQRPWSAFARIPTADGMAYFKAPAPPLRFEAPLTAALERWEPSATAPLLGLDRERGWFLSAHAGSTLRERDPSVGQLALWRALLPRYAELQIALIPRLPELHALGVPNHTLAALPERYAQLLADERGLMLGQPGGLSADEHARLQALSGQVRDWCAELAATGIPETLVHEEIHDANALVDGDRFTFIDWSDCSLGFPFCSLLVTLRAAAYRLKLEEQSPELRQLRDAYLEPWSTYGSRTELLRAFALAYRLAMIMRSSSWSAAITPLAEQHRAEYADNVPGWLQDFLVAAAQDDAEIAPA